jgi:hypothetical protein
VGACAEGAVAAAVAAAYNNAHSRRRTIARHNRATQRYPQQKRHAHAHNAPALGRSPAMK